MNTVEAILVRIRAIADRITGPEGYSQATLRSVSVELHAAADAADAHIALYQPPFTDGGAA
jgi:hypothetical protein